MSGKRIEAGGERQSDRDAMDRTTRRLIEGGMKPKDAVQTARDTARRSEYRQRQKR